MSDGTNFFYSHFAIFVRLHDEPLATEYNIVKKSGAWFEYNNGVLKVQGKEPFKEKLKANQSILDEIEQKVRDCLAGKEVEEQQ